MCLLATMMDVIEKISLTWGVGDNVPKSYMDLRHESLGAGALLRLKSI